MFELKYFLKFMSVLSFKSPDQGSSFPWNVFYLFTVKIRRNKAYIILPKWPILNVRNICVLIGTI